MQPMGDFHERKVKINKNIQHPPQNNSLHRTTSSKNVSGKKLPNLKSLQPHVADDRKLNKPGWVVHKEQALRYSYAHIAGRKI